MLALISALDVAGWLTPRPGRFTPGKETQYTFYWRLCELKTGLDGCKKLRLSRNSIRKTSSPWRVAIPTELSLCIISNTVTEKVMPAAVYKTLTSLENAEIPLPPHWKATPSVKRMSMFLSKAFPASCLGSPAVREEYKTWLVTVESYKTAVVRSVNLWTNF
jgi:hypothetical protein